MFSPDDVDDLWAWYDAGEGVTGGTSVTDWADQSGNGNDLTSPIGEEPDFVASGLNSLPVIQKAAGDSRMETAGVVPDLATLGGTIFIVGKQAASGDTNGPFITFGTSQSVSVRRLGATANAIRFGVNSSGGATNNDRTGFPDNTFYTLRLRVDNVSQYASINNDAESVVACILGAHAGGTVLNLWYNGSSTYGDKAIAEVLIYNRSLDTDEISDIEDYLQTKYNHY